MVAMGILVTLVLVVLLAIVGELALIYEEVKHEEPEKPAEPPVDIVLLTEIRDLLKAQQAAEASKEEEKAEE